MFDDIREEFFKLGIGSYIDTMKAVRRLHRRIIEKYFNCDSELLQLNMLLFNIEEDKSLYKLAREIAYIPRVDIAESLAYISDKDENNAISELLHDLKRILNPVRIYCYDETMIKCEDCPYAKRFQEGTCKCKYNYFYDKMLSMLGDKDESKTKST